MTKTELARFEQILRAKQTDLTQGARSWDIITIERSSDELDEAQCKVAREIAIVSLNHESEVRRSVAMGLLRIQDETFGTCVHCGEDIGRRRLEAVPWTPFCIRCQEAADLGEEHGFERLEQPLADAA